MAHKGLTLDETVELLAARVSYLESIAGETITNFHADIESLMGAEVDASTLNKASKDKVKAIITAVKDKVKKP